MAHFISSDDLAEVLHTTAPLPSRVPRFFQPSAARSPVPSILRGEPSPGVFQNSCRPTKANQSAPTNGQLQYDDGMDENPYQSPTSVPEVESSHREHPKKPLPLWAHSALSGFMVAGGLVIWQALIVDALWPTFAPPYLLLKRLMMYALYTLFASPAGVLMAIWAWRRPESKLALAVGGLVTLSWFVVALVGVLFFGMH